MNKEEDRADNKVNNKANNKIKNKTNNSINLIFKICRFFLKLNTNKNNKNYIDENSNTILSYKSNEGEFDIRDDALNIKIPAEQQIVDHLVEFRNLKVAEVMIPRTEIYAAHTSISSNELKKKFIQYKLTRMPIYKNNLDDLVGFIHVKDFLLYAANNDKEMKKNTKSINKNCADKNCTDGNNANENKNKSQNIKSNDEYENHYFEINKIIRQLIYVPRFTKCIDLLMKMRTEGTHLAVVLDEYGGTEGLVTIAHLVEEVVGNINDEHDYNIEKNIAVRKINDKSYIVDARTSIQDIEERLGKLDFLSEEEGEYETLGGFILSYLGRIPTKGEKFKHPAGIHIEILEANQRKIKSLKVTFDNKYGEKNGDL